MAVCNGENTGPGHYRPEHNVPNNTPPLTPPLFIATADTHSPNCSNATGSKMGGESTAPATPLERFGLGLKQDGFRGGQVLRRRASSSTTPSPVAVPRHNTRETDTTPAISTQRLGSRLNHDGVMCPQSRPGDNNPPSTLPLRRHRTYAFIQVLSCYWDGDAGGQTTTLQSLPSDSAGG
jgi:hypothetical protein